MKIENLPFPETTGSTTYRLDDTCMFSGHWFLEGTTLTLTTREDGTREIVGEKAEEGRADEESSAEGASFLRTAEASMQAWKTQERFERTIGMHIPIMLRKFLPF